MSQADEEQRKPNPIVSPNFESSTIRLDLTKQCNPEATRLPGRFRGCESTICRTMSTLTIEPTSRQA